MRLSNNQEATPKQYYAAVKVNLEHMSDERLDCVSLNQVKHCNSFMCPECPFPQLKGDKCHPTDIGPNAHAPHIQTIIDAEYTRRDRVQNEQISKLQQESGINNINKLEHLATQFISFIEHVETVLPTNALRQLRDCYVSCRRGSNLCIETPCPLRIGHRGQASLLTKEQSYAIHKVFEEKMAQQGKGNQRNTPDDKGIPSPHDIIAADKLYPGFADNIFHCTADRMNQLATQCGMCMLPSVQRSLCVIPRLSRAHVVAAFNHACEAKNTLEESARKSESSDVELSHKARDFIEHVQNIANCLEGAVVRCLYSCWRESRRSGQKLRECQCTECPLCLSSKNRYLCYAARLSDAAADIIEDVFTKALDADMHPIRPVIKLSSDDFIDADIISNISCD